MTITILLFLIGLALTICGADWLVDGASAIARKAGLSEFVIGMTIVGIGTSMPELVVSLNGALSGNSDVAIGNIIGSNVFNTFLILGVTALIAPLIVTESNRKRDLPINLGVIIVLILLGLKNTLYGFGENGLSRIDGAIFLVIFAIYMFFSFKNNDGTSEDDDEEEAKPIKIPMAILLVIVGICCLIFGGNLFVNKATDIAHALNVSDKFIAITILAGGTSLPELVTCVVAATKGKGQLALGNIVGSNISNILLILGCSSLIRPISFAGLSMVDLGAVLLGAVILLLRAYTFAKNKLDRVEAVILLVCEIAYFIYLVKTL